MTATSSNANTGGVTVEFTVTWAFQYGGTPWLAPHINADADLAGTAASGGVCTAGYSFSPYVSKEYDTSEIGNFSNHEDHGWWDGSDGGGVITASASAQSTNGGGESNASSAAYFVFVNNP